MGGWVEQLPSGLYRARYRAPDRTTVSSPPYRLKRDANEWLDDQLGDVVKGRWVNPRHGQQPFSEWMDEWATTQGQWKPSTREWWRPMRARIAVQIGGLPLAAIDSVTLAKMRVKLTETYAPSTVAQTMSYTAVIVRAAYIARRIGYDPTVRQRRRGTGGVKAVTPDEVPTRAEVLAILTATGDRYRAGVALGMAGLRISETLGMTGDRVDLPARRVVVDRQSDGKGGWKPVKNDRPRTITVPGVVAVELRRHLRDHDGGLLFPAGRGGMMHRARWYRDAWNPALAAAGLEGFTPHSLRHWCASTLLAAGAPVPAVAGHLGDHPQTVMATYAHWLRDDRDVPAGVLDRLLAEPGRGADVEQNGR